MSEPKNLHACAVVLGRTGLLVTGPSGSGKTELCLGLIEACRARDLFARFVSDDQVFLSAAGERLVVTAPQTISGLAELRGLGPVPVEALPAMIADRLVRMVPAAPRFAEPAVEATHGIGLPCLDVEQCAGDRAIRAVLGWLGLPPFAR